MKKFINCFGTPILNAGDRFNDLLVSHYTNCVARPVETEKADVIMVGSTLLWRPLYSEKKYKHTNSKPLPVWGTGCFGDLRPNSKFTRELDVRALRGKLTYQLLYNKEYNGDIALGDTGLLASRIIQKEPTVKGRIGFIPHYNTGYVPFETKTNKYHVVTIYPQLPTDIFCKEISKCEYIISESLHGIIFADSYNIPNARVVFGKLLGGDFKFQDYDSVFGSSCRYTLSAGKHFDNITKLIEDTYTITPEMITTIQDRLEEVNPLSDIEKTIL